MLKIHIIFGSGFPEELAQGKSQNIGWKTLKTHFIFGSELSLRS
ncbi:hypothetical protein E2320_000122 [Naja naja]|nr:hypothetical protein E2320_000122 [Naja naja]